jgi:hypothetical protein
MSLTLKKRGGTSTAYTAYTAGAPGDLDFVDLGAADLRPYGAYLAGNSPGWSLDNKRASCRFGFTVAGASGPDTKGMQCAWYNLGRPYASGNNKIYAMLAEVTGGSFIGVVIDISTLSVDLISIGALYADSNAIKVLTRYTDFWLATYWENTGGNNWELRVVYSEDGVTLTTIGTKSFTMVGKVVIKTYFGTQSQDTALISARISLPSLYQIGSVAADLTYPSEIFKPTTAGVAGTVRPSFYVRSDALGGGRGITNTAADAWTATEWATYAGITSGTIMGGPVIDPTNSNAAVDVTAIDVDTLDARFVAGTARHGGPRIYVTGDSNNILRIPTEVALYNSDNFELLAGPTATGPVELRGTTRLPTWSSLGSSVWEAALSCKYPVLFEFPDLATANSNSGKAIWLTHPGAITTSAGFIAVATSGSFGTDGGGGAGTKIWVRATGSGDPNSNGKIYEATTGADGDPLSILCQGGYIHDVIVRYFAGVNTSNNATNTQGRFPAFGGNGWFVCDNCTLHALGRHAVAIYEGSATYSVKKRSLLINNTMNDCPPTAYVGGGGQSMIVISGTTNGLDNQSRFRNNTCTTTTGVVGSATGTVDVLNDTVTDETLSGAHPQSKVQFVNNILPGRCIIGVTSVATIVTGNVMGYAGTANTFGGTTLTLTQNRITGIGLPILGEASGTSTIRSNIFNTAGAIATSASWLGTISFVGNTIDATATTGGTGQALATRGGVVAINFSGNAVLFNNSDLYRLFATITPASGDSLTMAENELQGADSSRILVTAYAGANTKTLAQLVSGGQDTASEWQADLKMGFNYEPAYSSAARTTVALATVPSLASTADKRGRNRAATGSVDAGALVYAPPSATRLDTALAIGV